MAIFLLPLFVKKEVPEAVAAMTLDEANHYITQRAIDILLKDATEDNRLATNIVVKNLDEQLVYIEQGVGKSSSRKILTHLQRVGIEAEEKKLYELVKEGKVSSQVEEIFKFYFKERISHSFVSFFKRIWNGIKLLFAGKGIRKIIDNEMGGINALLKKHHKLIDEFRTTDIILAQEGIDAIKKIEIEENRKEALISSNHYTKRMELIRNRNIEDQGFQNQVRALQLKGIQPERDEVQMLLEKGEITHKIAYSLKQLISYDEMILLDEDEI